MAAGPAEEGDDRFRALDGRLDPNEADAMTPRAGKRLCHSEGPGCFANITRRHDTGVHSMSQGQFAGTNQPRVRSSPRKLLIPLHAGVAKLADAQDLKSA